MYPYNKSLSAELTEIFCCYLQSGKKNMSNQSVIQQTTDEYLELSAQ